MAINIKTKVTSNVNLDNFTNIIISESKKINSNLQDPKFLEQLGSGVTSLIQAQIFDEHPIGHFMAPRTDYQIEAVAGRLQIGVTGLPESEVDSSKQTSGSIWNFFEYGGNTGDITDKLLVFESMHNFKLVFTYGREGKTVTKYAGEVNTIVTSMHQIIEEYVKEVAALGVEQYVSKHIIPAATGGKVRPQTNETEFLRSLGLNPEFMKKYNISFKFDSAGRPIFSQKLIGTEQTKRIRTSRAMHLQQYGS